MNKYLIVILSIIMLTSISASFSDVYARGGDHDRKGYFMHNDEDMGCPFGIKQACIPYLP